MDTKKKLRFVNMEINQLFEHNKNVCRKVSENNAVIVNTGDGFVKDDMGDVYLSLLDSEHNYVYEQKFNVSELEDDDE